MREHPWNIRRVTHRHLHDHRNLLDLHYLTHAWASGDSASLSNPFEKDPSLEDDTSPEDVLQRLEQAVAQTQLQILSERLLSKPSMNLNLNELSWRAGKECAIKRWPKDQASDTIAPSKPCEKRTLLMALQHSPLAGRLGADAFLIKRLLISEVSIELLNCPHRQSALYGTAATASSASPASPTSIDELCRQQFQWLRGFFEHLDPTVKPTLSRAGTPASCVVSW